MIHFQTQLHNYLIFKSILVICNATKLGLVFSHLTLLVFGPPAGFLSCQAGS